jgi:purine-binding chemotaxis protein CheW
MNQRLVRVSAGSQRWLVRVEDLREVVPMMALAPVAGQGGSCRGVLNLRGEPVPVFDGEGPGAPLSPARLILVLRERGGLVGFIVDEVHEVVLVPEERLAPRPVGGGQTRRMALLGEELLTVLEPGEVSAHGG